MRRARAMVGQHGFTLMELGMVALVLALVMGIAVPTVRSVTGAKARGEVGKLAANLRASRGQAALTGQTCRMVIDIDAAGYAVECAEGRVVVRREKESEGRLDEAEEQDEKHMTEGEKMRRQILKRASFAKAPIVEPQQLSGGMEFVSVWTSHQEEKYTRGRAYLYFFPSGLAERANIQMRHGDSFWTLQVSSVNGEVRVLPDRVDMKDTGAEDES